MEVEMNSQSQLEDEVHLIPSKTASKQELKSPSMEPPATSTTQNIQVNTPQNYPPQYTRGPIVNSAPVVMQQTRGIGYTPRRPNPNAYLHPLSLINACCCCICFGLLAAYFANKSDTSWAEGDEATAKSNATISKVFNVIGLIAGILIGGAIIAYFIVEAAAVSSQSS